MPGRDEVEIGTSRPHLDLQLDGTTAGKNAYQVRLSDANLDVLILTRNRFNIDSMDDNMTDAAAPGGDVSLNDQSLVFGSDIQMDPAEEDDRSWHIRSTPPCSHESYLGQTLHLYTVHPTR